MNKMGEENFMSTKVMLVDDHALIREGIKQLLEFDDSIDVIEQASDGAECLEKLQHVLPDILLLDEPTNHLDPMTQVIIADTFKTYEGTMLVVSHNLDFVDNLGISRMLLLPSGKIVYYDRDIVYHYEMINENK